MANLEQSLQNLLNVRQDIADLQRLEKRIKRQIHEIMNQQQTNQLVTNSIICTRDVRSRERIIREHIPEHIWIQLAELTHYPTLTLTELQ